MPEAAAIAAGHGDILAALLALPPMATAPPDTPFDLLDSSAAQPAAPTPQTSSELFPGALDILGQLEDSQDSVVHVPLDEQPPPASLIVPPHAELPEWLSSFLLPDAATTGSALMNEAMSATDGSSSSMGSNLAVEAPTIDARHDLTKTSGDLRQMASQGAPAALMLQYLSRARKRDGPASTVSAEAVLEGMIEYEQNQTLHSPSVNSQASSLGCDRRTGTHGTSPTNGSAGLCDYPNGPRLYQCDQCPLVFDRTFNLREHLKTHDPDRVKGFFCPLDSCNQASHRRADMHRHIKTVHIQKEKLSASAQRQIVAAYPSLGSDLQPHKKRNSKSQ